MKLLKVTNCEKVKYIPIDDIKHKDYLEEYVKNKAIYWAYNDDSSSTINVSWEFIDDNEKLKDIMAKQISDISNNISILEQERKEILENMIKL